MTDSNKKTTTGIHKNRQDRMNRSGWQRIQHDRRQQSGLGMATTKENIQKYKDSITKENPQPQPAPVRRNGPTQSVRSENPLRSGRAGVQANKAINCFGRFKNKCENFFGKGREELIDITENIDGTFQGIKLVGDANVPRGHINWRSIKPQTIHDTFGSHRLQPGTPFNVEFQVRTNIQDANDFSWVDTFEEGSLTMRYMTKVDEWKLSFVRITTDEIRATAEYSFVRVTDGEANDMIQARDGNDWD